MKAAVAPEPLSVAGERSRAGMVLLGSGLGLAWFVLCRHLSGEWRLNEQYSYGWFVPLFCACLFWLRWEDRPQAATDHRSEVGGDKIVIVAAIGLLLLLPLRVFEIGNPDWRPLGWLHALIVVALTLLALRWMGGHEWVRHFAFPVAFIFVAVPWISPIEQPIVQGLMRGVAAAATEAMSLCGIPAQVEGNLIRISSGVVGVNEACSGVRALQTALMIGLLLGEVKRLTAGGRIILTGIAVALSIFANFLRTFFLVWIAANRGIGAVDRWHDTAGYSIVALVFIGTLAAAALLGRAGARATVGRQKSAASSLVTVRSSMSRPLPVRFLVPVLVWLVLIEVASAAWYGAHERNLVAGTRWSVRWPSGLQDFRDIKIPETVRSTLRFDEGHAARWLGEASDATSPMETRGQMYALHCTLFFFRWNPGGGTLLRARAHRPDICLPSSGWEQIADHGVKAYRVQEDLVLPFRHMEFVRKHRSTLERDQFAHTFFCLQQDWMEGTNFPGSRAVLTSDTSNEWGIAARVRAVENGLRDLGQQTMELVFVTAQPGFGPTAEARFADLLPRLIERRQPTNRRE